MQKQPILLGAHKFLLCMALIAGMVLSVFGCARSPASDNPAATETPQNISTNETSGNETAEPEASEGVEELEEPEEPPIDLGGYEFVFTSLWGMDNEFFNPQLGDSPGADARYEYLQQVQNEYNFTVSMNHVSLDNFVPEIIANTMAGLKVADYIITDYARLLHLYSAGVLMEINETTAPNINLLDTEKWSPAVTEASTLRGRVYGFEKGEMGSGAICFFNATLLEERGATNPYDLWRDDNWTWEEFAKLLDFMTINESGGQTPDIYGLGVQNWGTYYFETAFIYTNGGAIIKKEGNDLRFALLDNDAQDALHFVKSIYDNRWILPALPRDIGNVHELLPKRRVAFFFDGWGVVSRFEDMEDDFGVLPLPKGPLADGYVTLNSGMAVSLVPITMRESDYFASSFIYNIVTEPLPPTGDIYLDDPNYILRNEWLRDDTAVEVVNYLMNNQKANIMNGFFDLQNIVLTAITEATSWGSATPRAAMEAIAEQSQALIDDFFSFGD